jgi:hypothetical protein
MKLAIVRQVMTTDHQTLHFLGFWVIKLLCSSASDPLLLYDDLSLVAVSLPDSVAKCSRTPCSEIVLCFSSPG